MKLNEWIREKLIYITVFVVLFLVFFTIYAFRTGNIGPEAATIYLQALTAVATLALLYYAYSNTMGKKEAETATLELAVRPIFIWEIESRNGGAELAFKTLKHPIYDLHTILKMDGKSFKLEDRHLDVFESNPSAERRIDVSDFISAGLGRKEMKLLELSFTYHSEVGGRYEFLFSKEVLKRPKGFAFQHRKIISAKYPWKDKKVYFAED